MSCNNVLRPTSTLCASSHSPGRCLLVLTRVLDALGRLQTWLSHIGGGSQPFQHLERRNAVSLGSVQRKPRRGCMAGLLHMTSDRAATIMHRQTGSIAAGSPSTGRSSSSSSSIADNLPSSGVRTAMRRRSWTIRCSASDRTARQRSTSGGAASTSRRGLRRPPSAVRAAVPRHQRPAMAGEM